MQAQQPNLERQMTGEVLKLVKDLVQQALAGIGIDTNKVGWTEMRWDVADLTATWSHADYNRNVHGWLEGHWPTYTLRFEGSVWMDEEPKKLRRVQFFSGPTGLVELEGPFDRPRITMTDGQNLRDKVKKLAERVNQGPREVLEYPLPPRPPGIPS